MSTEARLPDPTAVTASTPLLRRQAERLAQQLELPLLDDASPHHRPHYRFLLTYTPDRLELREQGAQAPGPVYVDFLAGKVAHRHRYGGGRRQTIARAVGLKPGVNPSIVDVTAGLAQDAFVLTCLGCPVRLIERSPVIAALLRDGIERARADASLKSLIDERLQLIEADSREFLRGLEGSGRPDVIYLDPMYPGRSKSALVKKEMRLLRRLVGDDDDAPQLLEQALAAARHRVVVKRPRLAATLAGIEPSFCLSDKTTRFDIYLNAQISAQNSNTATAR